jgi:hypothetical protein
MLRTAKHLRSTVGMYALINKHIGDLLKFLDRARDIDPYVDLLTKLHHVNVSSDTNFQTTYKGYWQLNGAVLSTSFCEAYFDYLQACKSMPIPTVEEVSRSLFKHATHKNGRHSLQFSFATKFVHMLNPRQPVYDSLIKQFYFLPSTGVGKKISSTGQVLLPEKRLSALLNSYRFLETEYKRIVSADLLAPSIQSFRKHFRVRKVFTDEKVIDTLIWGLVRLLKRGAIRDRSIVYT